MFQVYNGLDYKAVNSCRGNLALRTPAYSTTNTRPQRFFLRFKPAFWWTSINRYHVFSRVGLERILSLFLEHLEEHFGVL